MKAQTSKQEQNGLGKKEIGQKEKLTTCNLESTVQIVMITSKTGEGEEIRNSIWNTSKVNRPSERGPTM